MGGKCPADMIPEKLAQALAEDLEELLRDTSALSPEALRLRILKESYNFNALKAKAPHDERIAHILDMLLSVECNLARRTSPEPGDSPCEEDEPKSCQHTLLDELHTLDGDGDDRFRPGIGADDMAVQDSLQGELSSEIIDMVRKIRHNAEEFAVRLREDAQVVDALQGSIEKTESHLSSVGTRLSHYRRTTALGWFFYMKTSVAMIACVLIAMIIINLFPKFS